MLYQFPAAGFIDILFNWLENSARCPWNDTQESIRLITKNSEKIFFFLSFSFFFFFSFSSFSRPTQGQNLPPWRQELSLCGRTRPMNQKWLSSLLLCTHDLRVLTQVEEGFNFWEEGFNFLHGLFPYIRNPSIPTQESVRVRGILRPPYIICTYKHSRPVVPVLPFLHPSRKEAVLGLEQIFLSPVLNCVFTPQDANPRTP